MPSTPLRYCSPTCHTLTRGGRCPIHTRQQDKARGTAQQRGYDHAWHLYSEGFRAKHPFCGQRHDGTWDRKHSRCAAQGILTPAQCVDHTVPMSRGGSKWDEANHMSACFSCNTWKAKTLESQP